MNIGKKILQELKKELSEVKYNQYIKTLRDKNQL